MKGFEIEHALELPIPSILVFEKSSHVWLFHARSSSARSHASKEDVI